MSLNDFPEVYSGKEVCDVAHEDSGVTLKKPGEVDEQYLNAAAKYIINAKREWFLEDFMNRVTNACSSPEILKTVLKCDWHFSIGEEKVASINFFNDYVQIYDENYDFLGDYDWFYFAAAIQRMWNVVAIENAQKKCATSHKNKQEEKDISDNTSAEDVIDTSLEVVSKTENEQEVDLSDLSDLEILKDILESNKNLLRNALKLFPETDYDVRKLKLTVAALAAYIYELDNIINPPPEPEQPVLPEFKNNDQRKEWLRKYHEWGIWYEDEHIGCRYYKYDFENGARLIVEEYQVLATKYFPGHTVSYYHLIGGPEPKKGKDGCGKWERREIYSKYPDSETAVVEFLKQVQK